MKLKLHCGSVAAALVWCAGSLYGAPFIGSFSPAFGSSTDPNFVFIHGSGFKPGTLVVKFNGVQDFTASTAGAADGTLIQARVPAGATNGSNPIFVSVNGVGTFSAEDFTVIGPGPYISGFTPTNGAGGAAVTINGAHFIGTTAVRFNGRNAPGFFVGGDNQISVNAPAGVTSGTISVERTGVGTNTSRGIFYVPPVISGFNPPAARSGTNVIITGTNFLGTTTVRFNNLDATSFSVLSNGALQVTVPSGATSGLLRVITPAGSAFSATSFAVPPTLNGFAPGAGPVGTSVTLNGANFNVGTPVVRFSGVPAAAPTGVSFGQMTAVVPAGATTGPISVTTTDGSHTNAASFYLPPAITSFTPSNSAPGTLVRIQGTNFTDASAVTFDGLPAVAFFVTNNNTIGAFVPVDVSTGPISITTPGGTVNSTARFYAAPVITGFNPSHGLPGTNVTVFGQNFLDATALRFNGSNASFTVQNNTTLNATVPANAQTGPITIITPGGSNTTAQNFVLDYTANLSVFMTNSPNPVVVGSNVFYVITVLNSGPFPAPGVTFTDTLIGPALLLGATTSHGSLNTNGFPITGNLGQINVGDGVSITLTITAQAEGTITNIATVTSLYPDPNPANNSATNTTLVQPLPLLSIRRVGTDRVRVTWPAALTNYGLEFKAALDAALSWSNPPTAPAIVGAEYQLTETNNQTMRYYRLRRLQ